MAGNFKPLAPLAGYLRFFLKALLAVQGLWMVDVALNHFLQKSLATHVEAVEDAAKTFDDSSPPADQAKPHADKVASTASDMMEPTNEADSRVDAPDWDDEKEMQRVLAQANSLAAKSEADLARLEELNRHLRWLILSVYATIAIVAAYVVLYVLTGILFLRWIYRGYKNLCAFSGVALKRSPAWAVWSYFVPIASLFVPPLVMEEMWVASHKSGSRGLTALWWLSGFAWAVLAWFEPIGIDGGAHPSDHTLLWNLLFSTTHVILTALTLMLVTRISAAYARNVVEHLADAQSPG